MVLDEMKNFRFNTLQHYSGTTRTTEIQSCFIGKSDVIKCHSVAIKSYRELLFDQLATVTSSQYP